MKPIKIHPNLFFVEAWHGAIGVLGTVMVAGLLVAFSSGEFPDMWFLYLPAGIYLMIHGFGSSFGYFRLRYPSVKVGQNRIETEGTIWPRIIDFETVKRIELRRGQIQAEFTSSGNSDYIRIPFMLRQKDKLKTQCNQSGVEFYVEMK